MREPLAKGIDSHTLCSHCLGQCARVHAHVQPYSAVASMAAAAATASPTAGGAEEAAPTPPLSGRRASAWRAVGYAFGSRGSGTPEGGKGGPRQGTPPVGASAIRPHTPVGTQPAAVVSVEQFESALSMSACAIRCVLARPLSIGFPTLCCQLSLAVEEYGSTPVVPATRATCFAADTDSHVVTQGGAERCTRHGGAQRGA